MSALKSIFLGLGFFLVISIGAMATEGSKEPVQRGPPGYFPVQMTLQIIGDELTFRLTNMIPRVNYWVMVRTNKAYSPWIPFLSIINFGNTNATSVRMSLKTGKVAAPILFKGQGSGWEERRISTTAINIPLRMLPQMQFTAGSGEDADGDSMPDLYEDLVTRTDPLSPDTDKSGIADGYKDLESDGWPNLQEMYNGTDPLHWDQPPAPHNFAVQPLKDGSTHLMWQSDDSTHPTSFTIFRRSRLAKDAMNEVTFEVPPVRNKYQLYEFTDTNSKGGDFTYQVRANLPTPEPWITPRHANAEGIRQIMLKVSSKSAQSGYELTILKAAPSVRYLVLVREGDKGFWKASGFFVGATNGEPIVLSADNKGMLTTKKGPLILPVVEHLPVLQHPEFIAGSGEDADGDGLPDIYEVLATGTDPGKSDTGSTGMLDGYKDLSGDGWTTLEKYRRRADPLAKNLPPAPTEIIEPTFRSLEQALYNAYQSEGDFRYEVTVETRNLQTLKYQPLRQPMDFLFPRRQFDVAVTNLAIRISLQMPERKAPDHDKAGGP